MALITSTSRSFICNSIPPADPRKFKTNRVRFGNRVRCFYSNGNGYNKQVYVSQVAPASAVPLPPLPEPPHSSQFSEVLMYLGQLALQERSQFWRLLLSLACMVVSKCAGLLSPFYFKQAVDNISQGSLTQTQNFNTLVSPVCGLLIIFGLTRILNGIIKEFQYPIFLPVSQRISRRLAYHTFWHVLGLDVGFHLDQSSGRLSRILERGIRAIQSLFRSIVFIFIPTVIELTLVTVLLANKFNLVTGIGVLVTFVLYLAWTSNIIQRSAEVRKQVIELDNQTTSKAVDVLINFQTVKMFDNSRMEVTQYEGYLKEYQDASIVINNLSATQNGGQALILNSGLVAMLCAAVAFSQGTVTAGDLVLIQGLLLQLWSPLQFLGFFYRELRNALIDMGGVFDLLRRPPVQDGELNLPYHASGIDVEIRDVRFQYENQKREVLKGLSLRIKSGERVAIVGPSGSGKSTILKLLVRLHEPTAGNVYLEGVELTSLKQSSFKQAIAVVPQDTVLFNDSIQENIRYGRPQASDAEVIQAAKMARLHDSIQLMPRKYDTIVGERGLKLSGGEKQRVAIARAFLRQPRLLVCDEATSALDSATEFKIMQQLNELAQGRTSIFVAHRLSTIQNCDRILVMSDGQIVEEGTHAQLIAKDQIYSDMWNMQTNEDAGPEREQNTQNEPQFALVE